MSIISNQHLWLDNVISYRTRVELDKLPQLIDHIRENMGVLSLEITGDMVFSVTETIAENNNVIVGIEFIIPINKCIPSNCHFVFKPKFRLENAVMQKYCGKISEFGIVKKSLNEYALNHNVNILTDVYYELKQFNGDNVLLNAYMGVCGNSL